VSEFVRGCIGILTTGSVPDYFMDSMLAIDQPRGTITLRKSNTRTDIARNELVERMLKEHPSAQWLFFADSDMCFPQRTLMRLLQWKKPIVGGLYFLKAAPFEPVAYEYNELETARRRKEAAEKGLPTDTHWYSPISDLVMQFLLESQTDLPMDGRGHRIVPVDDSGRKKVHPLQPVDGIGTGCLLIAREVFEKLKRPFFSYSEGGTEDLYFCRRAKEAGYKLHVDLGVICGHMTLSEVSYQHFANQFALIRQGELREEVRV
jgi:hypothetical protein